MKIKEVLQKAIDKYGAAAQSVVAMEELAELQKEISKSYRGENNKEQLTEELADVYIMLMQLRIMHDIPVRNIGNEMLKKVERLNTRLSGR